MNKRLRKALARADYSGVAKLLRRGTPLGLEFYPAADSQKRRALTHAEMADYVLAAHEIRPGKWGYINPQGQLMIPARYDWAARAGGGRSRSAGS